VVADAGGAAPRTIAALAKLRAQFEAAKVGLVITLGGMGATQAELEATLGTLSDRAPWLTLALAGDLEPEPAQLAATDALAKRGNAIADARKIRWVELPSAALGTIPGAGA